MNERYSYRGKRLDNGFWIEGGLSYCSKDDTYHIVTTGKDRISYIGYHQQIDPATIGQCTGLKDKNGKLVFEGDIVQTHWGEKQIVEWVDDSCGFEPFSDSRENCGHCGGGASPKSSEIIGNIHDNPELCGEKTPDEFTEWRY